MTPKEKAKELFDKMASVTGSEIDAKEYAIIAVDEMLKCSETDYIKYLQQVKLELEAL